MPRGHAEKITADDATERSPARSRPGHRRVRSAPPRAELDDLTDEQWARIDTAAGALDLQVCEDLSGADGGAEDDDTDGRTEEQGAAAGTGAAADTEMPLPVPAADQAAEPAPLPPPSAKRKQTVTSDQ
ncbi:hypothetical protein ACWIG5_30525 [Streptomyces lydicus]